ncbi:MAG: putative acyl-CoA dehydrogenase, partial [Frankiales bacterium]|nr:putative acyl-CoA dehydrogenase [Frankiales bacterium]
MDLSFTPEEAEFREQARTWLAENFPTEPRPTHGTEVRDYDLAWQRKQYDGGWAGVAWPVEYGGRGLPLLQQMIWFEEYARTGAPDIDIRFVGLSHAGPTLMAQGTHEQKEKHLLPILRGDVAWSQGFSEPDAGSDLASLRTTGVIDGDELVVNGQKVWTSFAHMSDWQELLVRTNPDVPKHKGLTWTICDMTTPGLTIRPIMTMDRDDHFCEVFYDDVRIPLTNVVGGVDNGWSTAMSTLSFERGTAFTVGQVQLAIIMERLIELAKERVGPDGRRPAIADDEIATRLATLRAEIASLRSLTYASIARNASLPQPGPEGSMIKLFYSEVRQRLLQLAVDIMGPDSQEKAIGESTWAD